MPMQSCPKCLGAGALDVANTPGLIVPCPCVPDEVRWREARIPLKYQDAPPMSKWPGEQIPMSRWIFGPPGTGKTRLACRILKRQSRARFGGLFVDLVELEGLRRDAVSAKEIPPGREAMEAPFLVADDFARNHRLTDFWREYLEGLVRARYSARLPTVFTSNFSLEEIAQNQGTWLAGRIAEMVESRVHPMEGKDRRWLDAA